MSRFPPPLRMPLLSIDPGKNALGWAYAGDSGHILCAGVVRSETPTQVGGDDVAMVARHVLGQLRLALGGLPPAASLVIEKMRVYPGPQGAKTNPNDLIDLSYLSGGVHMLPEVRADVQVVLVEPRDWKGQIPKEKMVEHRIKPSLSVFERKLVEASMQHVPDHLKHNGWDGVGLNLWGMQRLRGPS